MSKEIERKWYCKSDDFVKSITASVQYEYIMQRYFQEENDDNAVGRVRMYYRQGTHENPKASVNLDRSEITIKSGRGLTRAEANVPVDRSVSSHIMWPHPDVVLVEKKRYKFSCNGYIAELDVYEGDNKGLVHIEIEFDSEDQALAFNAPELFGEEVTDDMSHTNASLQNRPFSWWLL